MVTQNIVHLADTSPTEWLQSFGRGAKYEDDSNK